jgi:hypothetical protein
MYLWKYSIYRLRVAAPIPFRPIHIPIPSLPSRTPLRLSPPLSTTDLGLVLPTQSTRKYLISKNVTRTARDRIISDLLIRHTAVCGITDDSSSRGYLVSTCVSRFTCVIEVTRPFDSTDKEHLKRARQAYTVPSGYLRLQVYLTSFSATRSTYNPTRWHASSPLQILLPLPSLLFTRLSLLPLR